MPSTDAPVLANPPPWEPADPPDGWLGPDAPGDCGESPGCDGDDGSDGPDGSVGSFGFGASGVGGVGVLPPGKIGIGMMIRPVALVLFSKDSFAGSFGSRVHSTTTPVS